ncbi:hypothetical protein [Actinophytocola sp.]|uniref:hypothetical protein n=1 Tax=Actinophytocola sp. TaxID=1872138 RepID=UPI003D6BDC88
MKQPDRQPDGAFLAGVGVDKPAAVSRAARLGHTQAGITLLLTVGLVFTLIDSGRRRLDGGEFALEWAVAIGQLGAVVLLIFGSARLMSGTGRTLFLVACGLELALCLFYLIGMVYRRIQMVDKDDGVVAEEVEKQLQVMFIVGPILLAVMPIIGIVLALGGTTTGFLQAKKDDIR